MPTNKTHIITGSGLGAVVATALQLPVIPLIIGASLGAGIPDIDSEKSTISRKILIFKNRLALKITYIIIGLAAIIIGQISLKLIGAFLILTAISGHRKFTHSILGLLSFCGICLYALNSYSGIIRYFVLGLIIGYATHILTDSFSNHGIELFWPLSEKNFGIRLISTGKMSEHIFLAILSILIYIIINHFLHTTGRMIWF